MENISIELLVVLVASTSTLVSISITKIIDYFQSKNKFKQELKAKYFDKKLNVAEQIVEALSYNITAYEELTNAFQVVYEVRSDELRNHISTSLARVSTLVSDFEKMNKKFSLIDLYFRTDNKFNTKIKILIKSMYQSVDNFHTLGPEHSQDAEITIISELIATFSKISKLLQEKIQFIKKDFAKYEL